MGYDYESCARKNCTSEGKYQLAIIYLNKSGWFCNSCKEELLKENLFKEEDSK